MISSLGLLLFLAAAAPAADTVGVHPIVEVATGVLLGGTVDGRWQTAEEIAPRVKGGETYRVYTTSRQPETGRGGPAAGLDDYPDAWTVPLAPARLSRANRPGIALAGAWNARPRTPRVIKGRQAVYVQAVREWLQQHGIPQPRVHITQIWRIDLEGDGQEEVLLSATSPRREISPTEGVAGDYSCVLLRRLVAGQVVTVPLAEQYFRHGQRDNGDAPPEGYTLHSALDLDGDGTLEVIVNFRYYEGYGQSVYQLQGNVMREVLSAGFCV